MSHRFGFGLFAVLGLALGAAAPPVAQQDQMKKDAMAKDKDAMGKDGMAMDHAMDHGTMMLPHGAFAGAEGHKAGGSYEIAREGGKTVLELGPDFSVEKGPDVYVVLSPGPKVPVQGAGALFLGKLTKFAGPQTFDVPAGTDLKPFSHVVLWCKKYRVAMGTAPLAAGDGMMHK